MHVNNKKYEDQRDHNDINNEWRYDYKYDEDNNIIIEKCVYYEYGVGIKNWYIKKYDYNMNNQKVYKRMIEKNGIYPS